MSNQDRLNEIKKQFEDKRIQFATLTERKKNLEGEKSKTLEELKSFYSGEIDSIDNKIKELEEEINVELNKFEEILKG